MPDITCLSTPGSLCEHCKGLLGANPTVKLVNGKTFALSGSIGRVVEKQLRIYPSALYTLRWTRKGTPSATVALLLWSVKGTIVL